MIGRAQPAVLLLPLALACAPTQTDLRFVAPSGPVQTGTSLNVRVLSQDGAVTYDETREIGGAPSLVFPATVPVGLANGDATRTFAMQASLRDATGAVYGEQRARSGFVVDEHREIWVCFDPSCTGVVCRDGTRCASGVCIDDFLPPLRRGEADPASSCASLPVDAAVDAPPDAVPDVQPDAATPDSGCGAMTMIETCNGVDDDCNGIIDDGPADCEAATGCSIAHREGDSYLLCATALWWLDARDACASFGYHLVVVDDGAEQTFIALEIVARGGGNWWLGLRDEDSDSLYEDSEWVVGISSYRNWRNRYPADAGGCAMLEGGEGNQWRDRGCANRSSYICEAP